MSSSERSQLVKPIHTEIQVGEPFIDEDEPCAKRHKQDLSPSFHQEDVPIPEPFTPSSTFSDRSTLENNSVSSLGEGSIGTTGHGTGSVSNETPRCSDCTSDMDDIDISEPFDTDESEYFCDSNTIPSSDDSEKLYPSSQLTVVQCLAILFTWFCSYPGISKEAFSRLLYLLNSFLLPAGNILPTSYQKARVAIKHFLVPAQEYDCCINDCIVFRKCAEGDFKHLSSCPKCGEARYQPCSKIARKKFKYIPLVPRFKRMFGNEIASQLLQSHQQENPTEIVSDLHQSPAWKSRYDVTGPFQGDPRGISLSLCTDGTNPFSKERVVYSMWPITLSILNLPRQIRNLPGSIILAGIIPGKSEPQNMDPYMEILVDELCSVNGLELYDSYRNEKFQLKVDLLLHILDYPGQNKLFHCQGAGAYAGCTYCTHKGEYSKILQKMIYPGNRCFLQQDDDLRHDFRSFPQQGTDLASPPKMKTMEYVDCANARYSAADSNKEKNEIAQECGCKGSYSLRKLPLHERLLNTPVEPMHLIKNIVAHCINLIAGHEDSYKVREEEKFRKRFPTAWVKDQCQSKLPPAPFALSRDNIALADERAKRVLVPAGFDWRPREIFSKTTGMKSHEWKQIACNGILKFCLRGMLGQKQRKTLYQLFDVLTQICAEDIDINSIDGLEQQVHRTLALLERDLPVSMQVIVFHLLHHLPMFLKQFGPVYTFWMYPYERFNSWITRRVLNRRYPEATVVETYRLTEWANYMEISHQLPEGATSTHLEIDEDKHQQLTEETSENPLLSEKDSSHERLTLTEEQMEQLHSHYLAEIPEYTELTEQYENERKQAKVYHQVRSFPKFSEWVPKHSISLSDSQLEMRYGPSHEAVKLKYFTYKDSHNRSVMLTSVDSDREHTYRRCSYVSTHMGSVLMVGRIVTIFEHSFLSTTTFAYVSWFDGPYRDTETNLVFVLASAQTQSVTPIMSLSKPLVVAYDDEELDKIWILNLHLDM